MWAHYTHSSKNKNGFTIVELLIVIVVIAILASVTVVTFNGTQQRATFSKYQTELKSIVKALELYKTEHDTYPPSIDRPDCDYDWCGWDQATGEAFIVGLSPRYIERIPQMDPALPKADSFLYRANASQTEYQLIRYRGITVGDLPIVEMENNPLYSTLEDDNDYDNRAWGYKSNPNTPWW